MIPAHRLADARPHPPIPAHRLADARPHPAPGPLLLSGGRDHTRASAAGDRALLAGLKRVATPRAVVVSTASGGRPWSATEMRATRHWERLGVAVELVTASGDAAGTHPPAALREADLILLTGGRPPRSATVAATALWPSIVERWRQGAALAGSSTGAAVLCGWRRDVGTGHPLRFVRSTGVVPDVAAAPHFNRSVVRRWTVAASRAQPYLTIIGVDERTALVGCDGRFTVHGRGAVTIVRAGRCRRYAAGSRLHLPLHAPAPAPPFPFPWAPLDTGPARRVTEPLSG